MAKATAPYIGKTGNVSLTENVFGEEFNNALVHETVRAEQNALRSGTASTLSRGEVNMTGAKAWRQKGTGRARVGALSAPHRTGGSVAFGPKPRHYTFKINRKARRKAMRAVLSLHAGRGTLAVVDPASFDKPNTKQAADQLSAWKATGTAIVVVGPDENTAALSFRNLERVRSVVAVDAVTVADLIASENLIVSEAALERLTQLASAEVKRGGESVI